MNDEISAEIGNAIASLRL